MKHNLPPSQRELLLIALILILATLHGLMYVFLMPPWQHYDEPNHFEYVWLTARLDRLPVANDSSPKLNRQVLRSMLVNGFYDQISGEKPVLGPPSEKVTLPGYSQLSEPPLYYLLASLPVRMLAQRGIDAQLYGARLVSLFFLLITILAAWAVVGELVPAGHPLRWLLPISLALTPAFVDLMTAVNNDTAAIAFSAVTLWVGVRLIRNGFTWSSFLLFCIVIVLTWFTKITALAILAMVPPVLLFAFLRGKNRKFAWMLLGLALVAGLVVSLRRDDAFAWYRNTSQSAPLRMKNDLAPLGNNALTIVGGVPLTPPWYPEAFQHLPGSTMKSLAGKPVTFGYWIWSDQSQRVRAPALRTTEKSFAEALTISTEPVFYAFQAMMPEAGGRVWIDLAFLSEQTGSHIYVDGLALVEGRRPITDQPIFDTAEGRSGVWGGERFQNLLRNPSAETPGPRLIPAVDDFIFRILPGNVRPSLLLASLVDSTGSQDLYPVSARHLFQTYWARFGWGHVPVFGAERVYRILEVFSLLAVLGALSGAVRYRRSLPWDIIAVYGMVTLLTIMMALTRGGANLVDAMYYFPTARYIYPAIIPIHLMLICGWLAIFGTVHRVGYRLTNHAPQIAEGHYPAAADSSYSALTLLLLVFLIIIDLLAVLGITQYYHL